jgi:hypothetical protein
MPRSFNGAGCGGRGRGIKRLRRRPVPGPGGQLAARYRLECEGSTRRLDSACSAHSQLPPWQDGHKLYLAPKMTRALGGRVNQIYNIGVQSVLRPLHALKDCILSFPRRTAVLGLCQFPAHSSASATDRSPTGSDMPRTNVTRSTAPPIAIGAAAIIGQSQANRADRATPGGLQGYLRCGGPGIPEGGFLCVTIPTMIATFVI